MGSDVDTIKITILCENRAGLTKNIIGEHGFSAIVEKDGQKILFDTGQGLGLKLNAKTLGIDLSQIDIIVLSHGIRYLWVDTN